MPDALGVFPTTENDDDDDDDGDGKTGDGRRS